MINSESKHFFVMDWTFQCKFAVIFNPDVSSFFRDDEEDDDEESEEEESPVKVSNSFGSTS